MRVVAVPLLFRNTSPEGLVGEGQSYPVFLTETCCGTVRSECLALDCVSDTDPILTVQEHGSGRIGASSLPGHDLRHLATAPVRNAG